MSAKNITPKYSERSAAVELQYEMTPGEVLSSSRSGGLQFFSNSFKRGYGTDVFGCDENGLWLGAAEYADAPFRVDYAGNATLSSVTLDNTDLDDIADGTTYKRVNANEKSGAGYAYTGLDASGIIKKGFTDANLSAVSLPTNGIRVDSNGIYGRKSGATTFYLNTTGDAYFKGTIAASTITGTTVTGGTVQTASSGQRVVMNGTDSRLDWYDSSGNIAGRIYSNFVYWYLSNGTLMGSMGNISGAVTITGHNSNNITLIPGSGAQVQVSGDIYIVGELTMNDNIDVGSNWINNCGRITSANDVFPIPQRGSDPGSANNGEIYYNTAAHTFRAYKNGSWQNVF